MILGRVIVGTAVGALVAAAAFAVPAVGATDGIRRVVALPGSVGTFFTPASADPKLAALVARSGFGATRFRFTPADSRSATPRVVSLAKAPSVAPGIATSALTGGKVSLGIAPITFNLASTEAWKNFSLSGDLAKVDLATATGSRKSDDGSAASSARRASAKLVARAEQPTPGSTHLIGDAPSYSIDVGGSYSLTKNFDVTAGVRYKSQDRDRLSRLASDRPESQAVYVGTAFKF